MHKDEKTSLYFNLSKKEEQAMNVLWDSHTPLSATEIGKGYGRLFRATISANEYAVMQFNRYYQYSNGDSMFFISSLLDKVDDEEKLVETLQALLNKYREN